MIDRIKTWVNAGPLSRYIGDAQDRIVLFGALSTPVSLVMALIKLILGLVYLSTWLLGFGLYYLVLVLAKVWLYVRYTRIRKQVLPPAATKREQYREMVAGGTLFAVLGLVFAIFCAYMLLHGYSRTFSLGAVLTIATIGFVKLISAIVNLLRARKHRSPLISLLKTFSLADGLVAIVLTQYAILAMKKSPTVNTSTGLFGLVIGVILMGVGTWFVITSRQRLRDE